LVVRIGAPDGKTATAAGCSTVGCINGATDLGHFNLVIRLERAGL
jgi:hypothetical protein